MSYCVDDTIVALASAPGGAVRGVLRMSGPDTRACLLRCFTPDSSIDLTTISRPTVIVGNLTLAAPLNALPCDLYFWPTARSYTRQISAELHTIGSPPLLDAALETLCDCGARLASPGEFTMRAFLAGRIDLTQAEAVLGVIDAQDATSLNVALRQLAGGLAAPLSSLRCELLDLLADLEAGLDFVDEDLMFIDDDELARRLASARRAIECVLEQIASRNTGNREPHVVLRGCANVGKSSLLNALSGHSAAIVSDQAGTTRDYVTRPFSWGEFEGILVDTAGIEPSEQLDAITRQAQQLGADQLREADVELLCLDATRPLNAWERHATNDPTGAARRLIVWTKIDAARAPEGIGTEPLATSSHTGEGIEVLRAQICSRLAQRSAPSAVVVASTAQRCQHCLDAALRHVRSANQLLVEQQGHELIALELRETLQQLGQVVGAVYTDDILDRIFSRFCIGK